MPGSIHTVAAGSSKVTRNNLIPGDLLCNDPRQFSAPNVRNLHVVARLSFQAGRDASETGRSGERSPDLFESDRQFEECGLFIRSPDELNTHRQPFTRQHPWDDQCRKA